MVPERPAPVDSRRVRASDRRAGHAGGGPGGILGQGNRTDAGEMVADLRRRRTRRPDRARVGGELQPANRLGSPGPSRGGGQTKRRQTSYSSLYGLGVGASYEVDLWSRVRSSQQAALLEAQAGRDAVDTAAITLSAAVANTWYQLAEAMARVRIARQQIETNQQVLKVVTVQYRNGMASAADVLRQRQLVSSTEAQLIAAQEAVELLQYTLSVLIGAAPQQAWRDADLELPDLAPMPDPGVPADILWRRPDVRRAYRQVQAADRRLAVAVAEQYPRLSLSASVESSVPSVSDLFDDWLANFTANAFQPLFDAGLRKAEVERQEAIVSERLHTWGQTLLSALQEVETALTQQRQQELLWENLEHRLGLARETYRRNRERFVKGQVDYIRVLESLSSLQVLERSVITARRLRIQFRIDLYRSIAGPWEMAPPALAQIDEQSGSVTNSETTVYQKKAPL